ncbi:acetylxylan esterase [Microbacterium sp. NPDC016588]
MPFFDRPLAELEHLEPSDPAPPDFDVFWDRTLAEARAAGGSMELTPQPTAIEAFRVFDVRFPGFGGEPIGGWLIAPREPRGPAMVAFQGYNAGRGDPVQWLGWPSAGFTTLVMDTRGQGSVPNYPGVTPDPHGHGPATLGMRTRGIDDPETYYYRRVFTDAVRAVDAVRTLDGVDPQRVGVVGGSQGGGIALAAAGLHDGVAAALIDVPFLCDFRRAVGLTGAEPYEEITRYLAAHRGSNDRVFRTLSYFDGISFAARATAPALVSVALQDAICPPSTVFAAFNAYGGPAEIDVFPFNGHEGGGAVQWERQARFVRSHLGNQDER